MRSKKQKIFLLRTALKAIAELEGMTLPSDCPVDNKGVNTMMGAMDIGIKTGANRAFNQCAKFAKAVLEITK